ncbi:MAG TPA: PAS domain-containing protein, partial [Parasulfuritortus sp.]
MNIRRLLMRGMTALLVVFFALFSLATYLVVLQPSQSKLAATGMRDASLPLLVSLRDNFAHLENTLASARQLTADHASGPLDENQIRALNSRLIPLLATNPQVTAFILAEDDGRSYLLLRNDDGTWTNRIAQPASWGKRAHFYTWRDANTPLSDAWRDNVGFNSSERPWYRGAVAMAKDGGYFWTDPYIFFASGRPGITVSMPWRDAAGKRYVIAMDILLKTVSTQTQALAIGSGGSVAVLTGAGQIIGLPRELHLKPEVGPEALFLQAADKFPGSPLAAAYRAWLAKGQPAGRPFDLHAGRRDWLAEFLPLQLGDKQVWVAAYAPQDSFAPWLARLPGQMLVLLLAGSVLAALLSAWLARRFSEPVENLVEAVEALSGDDLSARVREQGPKEIRRLGSAFNGMAERLAAHKADLARQAEALRQLNRELENQVARRSAVLSALFDTLPYPVFVKGVDTVFSACNQAYEAAFGIAREDFIGKRVLDLDYLPMAEREAFQAEDERIIASRGAAQREIDIVYADGSTHRVIYMITAFQLADGSPAGMLGVLFDITERYRAEARLKEITDDLPGAVFQLRRDPGLVRHVDFISAGIERLFGIAQTDALDSFDRVFAAVEPSDQPLVIERFRNSADGLARLLINFRVRTLDGLRWVHCEANPHRGEDGTILWNGSLTDITAEKEV